jgi:hypothetical protein
VLLAIISLATTAVAFLVPAARREPAAPSGGDAGGAQPCRSVSQPCRSVSRSATTASNALTISER